MLNLKNDVSSLEELFDKNRHVILYGAGASARLLLRSHYEQFPRESLEYIVDIKESLDGTYCVVDDNIRIKIISLKHFCEMWEQKVQQVTFLLTQYYALFYIKSLDCVDAIHQMNAYVYPFIVNRAQPDDFALKNTATPMIPKVIHYFWIGDSEMPEEYQKNLASWKRFCPDYEIIRWDESTYDFSKYRYAREAIENRQYMYATDVARKDILYTYGGIYFDTDVELLRPIDDLLYNEAFIGIDDGGQLNSGSGLGAVKKNEMIKKMRDLYEDKTFVRPDGNFNFYFNTFYETEFMIRKGYKIGNQFQNIGGMSCFPRTVLMPEGVVGLHNDYTDQTVANHKINPRDWTEVASIRERLYGEAGCGK